MHTGVVALTRSKVLYSCCHSEAYCPSQSLHVQASDTSGTFSVIKAADNSGNSQPGATSNKKLSAAQLANAQQVIKQANEMAATTNYTGPIVSGSGDDYTQARSNAWHANVSNARYDNQEGNLPSLWHQVSLQQGTQRYIRPTTGNFVSFPSHAISCSIASLQQRQMKHTLGGHLEAVT